MNKAVVDFQEVEPGIALVTMQDRENKNTFSIELMAGLATAFDAIDANENFKVVILTGYDTYFCSGGTQKGLLDLFDSKTKFVDSTSDRNIYSIPLDCKIPVISAMQGHGIGGGFVMGLYSDFVILSRESIYATNFMKYGFSPGFGGTYIVPKKLGFSLGEEMLLNAGSFRGVDLEKRGVPFPVIPRADVMDYALELAREVAEKPRLSLITLKDHLVASIRDELPAVIEKELAMHEITFGQEEVKDRILKLFGN